MDRDVRKIARAIASKPREAPRPERATLVRIGDDGTAYVHFAGGVDETPATLNMAAKVGDEVTVWRVGGRCVVSGNVTAPADVALPQARAAQATAAKAQATAEGVRAVAANAELMAGVASTSAAEAKRVATAIDQHFWHDAGGAHVTQSEQDLTDGAAYTLTSGGSIQTIDGNIVRSDTRSGTNFYDGTVTPSDPNLDGHATASFNRDGAVIGIGTKEHMEVSSGEQRFYQPKEVYERVASTSYLLEQSTALQLVSGSATINGLGVSASASGTVVIGFGFDLPQGARDFKVNMPYEFLPFNYEYRRTPLWYRIVADGQVITESAPQLVTYQRWGFREFNLHLDAKQAETYAAAETRDIQLCFEATYGPYDGNNNGDELTLSSHDDPLADGRSFVETWVVAESTDGIELGASFGPYGAKVGGLEIDEANGSVTLLTPTDMTVGAGQLYDLDHGSVVEGEPQTLYPHPMPRAGFGTSMQGDGTRDTYLSTDGTARIFYTGNDWIDDPSQPILTVGDGTNYDDETSLAMTLDRQGNLWTSNGGMDVLWEGAWYMTAGHTAVLARNVSQQLTGIVLVWSAYTGGTVRDYDWQYTFVPKWQATENEGGGVDCLLVSGTNIARKYLYVSDDRITGHADNGATKTYASVNFTNNAFVLRAVIGV